MAGCDECRKPESLKNSHHEKPWNGMARQGVFLTWMLSLICLLLNASTHQIPGWTLFGRLGDKFGWWGSNGGGEGVCCSAEQETWKRPGVNDFDKPV